MLRRYSLSLALLALYLVSLAIQVGAGWVEFGAEQGEHGQAATVATYAPVALRTMFENNASEFLQLLAFVVLSASLVHEGSPQSKTADEATNARLDRIEALLQEKD